MEGFNFFAWIRDGVRRSVLLGVSDAVEQLGAPDSEEELHPGLAGVLHLNQSSANTPRIAANKKTTGKRRLGKSLKEMGTAQTSGSNAKTN